MVLGKKRREKYYPQAIWGWGWCLKKEYQHYWLVLASETLPLPLNALLMLKVKDSSPIGSIEGFWSIWVPCRASSSALPHPSLVPWGLSVSTVSDFYLNYRALKEWLLELSPQYVILIIASATSTLAGSPLSLARNQTLFLSSKTSCSHSYLPNHNLTNLYYLWKGWV